MTAFDWEGSDGPIPRVNSSFVTNPQFPDETAAPEVGLFPVATDGLVMIETAQSYLELSVTIRGFTFDVESLIDARMLDYDRIVGGGTRARRRYLAKVRAKLR